MEMVRFLRTGYTVHHFYCYFGWSQAFVQFFLNEIRKHDETMKKLIQNNVYITVSFATKNGLATFKSNQLHLFREFGISARNFVIIAPFMVCDTSPSETDIGLRGCIIVLNWPENISFQFQMKNCFALRIWWIIAFGFSAVLFSMSIQNIWMKWHKNPVTYSFSEKQVSISSIPFPTVTICPETKTKKAKLDLISVYYSKLMNLTEEQ